MLKSFDRKRSLLKACAAISFICSLLFCLHAPAIAQVSLAPLNPDFLDYMDRIDRGIVGLKSSEPYTPGFIPPPVNLSHLTGLPLLQAAPLMAAPASYDLRALGKVTPVRDQGECGSCWAFATYASLESNLLPSEPWDFSENNLKNRSGFDLGPCNGGNALMSTAYLSRWDGSVAEGDDPYGPDSNISPSGLPVGKHIQNVLIIPDRSGPSDNENIKQAIMVFGGALYTALYQNNSYYNPVTNSYYFNGSNPSNHAVAIVGWDDHYDKANFSINPPDHGAFIVKNSWGAGWGENGFYYVSYYDSNIGKYNYAFNNAEEVTNYRSVYQYDPLGWTDNLGYRGSDTAWFANVFTATASEQLAAVSFYADTPNSPYEIYVYNHIASDPTSGSLEGNQAGVIDYAGYHTIRLDSPVPLVLGKKFSVVVKLTPPGNDRSYPVPLESRFWGYSSRATAEPGQGYVSIDGSNWTDITSFQSPDLDLRESSVCIKAFTLGLLYPDVTLLTPKGDEAISAGSTYRITWGSPPDAVLFNLYYSLNKGATWRLINGQKIPRVGDTTDFFWTVPSPRVGNKQHCRIKVVGYDASGKRVTGSNKSSEFRIDVVKLTLPNGGNLSFRSNDSIKIAWTVYQTFEPITRVQLYYSRNGGASWTLITRPPLSASFGSPGDHLYEWKIPTVKNGPRNKWRIKVTLKSAKRVSRGVGMSENTFLVQPPSQ